MPELPEVETIRRGLAGELTGSIFSGVEIINESSMPESSSLGTELLLDQEIVGLRRRGKVLIIDVGKNYSLLIHLKMTGQLILERPDGGREGGGHPTKAMVSALPDKSTRVVFDFSDGKRLFFNDQRKFGWIKLKDRGEVEQDSLLMRMGEEPLEAGFIEEVLRKKLRGRKAPIKALLLDQTTVAGLGNIYVDESLHLAKIHPETKAIDLNDEQIAKLHSSIVNIIRTAVRLEGTTLRNYLNHRGEKGGYFEHARVFDRTGLPCPECGEEIEKIRVAGRGTHICVNCQRK